MKPLPSNARKDRVGGHFMEVFSMVSVPKGIFINARAGEDFWIMLGKNVGWGRFSMIRPDTGFVSDGGIFGLAEVRPLDAEPPESAIVRLNVLWRAQEGYVTFLENQTSALQGILRELKHPQEPE